VRSSLIAVPAALVLAATLSGCGSTKAQVSGPPTTTSKPAKLALAADSATAATGSANGAVAAGPEPAIYPKMAPPTFTLVGSLADLGTTAPVRMLAGHDVTAADIARIADALGMHGTAAASKLGYELRDGDATLTVDTTGSVTVVDYSNIAGGASVGGSSGDASGASTGPSVGPSTGVATAPPTDLPLPVPQPAPEPKPVPEPLPMPTIPPPVDVPSADGAVGIAQALLDNFGVLDGQQWSHEVEDPNAAVSSCAPDADCPAPVASPVYSRTVTFQLLEGDAPVPGVSWSVTIGSHGHVDYLNGTWAQAQGATDYPLQTTAKVFEDMKNGTAQYVNGSPGGEVRVTGVKLGVARWDGTEDAKAVAYLVPTYRFQIAGIDGASSYAEVLALDPASFKVAPNADLPVPEPALAGKEVEQ